MKNHGRNKAESRSGMKMLLAKLREDPVSWIWRSQEICRQIERLPLWRKARVAGAFVPLGSEPQIQPLWQGAGGPAFCFPQIRGDAMTLRRIDDRETLRRADWRLALPEFDAAPAVPLADLEVLLVPGLAFTRAGIRLGRGGGHYDRLLAERGPGTWVLGVCFEIQVVAELPFEAHDCKVDAVVTESGVIAI
jgi:5-formyltetrahydrofolate cyclo-ligase